MSCALCTIECWVCLTFTLCISVKLRIFVKCSRLWSFVRLYFVLVLVLLTSCTCTCTWWHSILATRPQHSVKQTNKYAESCFTDAVNYRTNSPLRTKCNRSENPPDAKRPVSFWKSLAIPSVLQDARCRAQSTAPATNNVMRPRPAASINKHHVHVNISRPSTSLIHCRRIAFPRIPVSLQT